MAKKNFEYRFWVNVLSVIEMGVGNRNKIVDKYQNYAKSGTD